MWPRWAGIWGLRWDIPGNITRIHGQPRTWSLKVLNPGYHFGSLNKKVTKSKISFEVKYKEVGFPCGSAGKKKIRLQCWRPWFDSWLGRSPGEGNSYPLQYSSLENSMSRGGWQAKSVGSQRAEHDRATCTFTFCSTRAEAHAGQLESSRHHLHYSRAPAAAEPQHSPSKEMQLCKKAQ